MVARELAPLPLRQLPRRLQWRKPEEVFPSFQREEASLEEAEGVATTARGSDGA